MEVGKRIKEERTKQRISQKELAKMVGLSASYLCDIEVGRTNPSLKTLTRLSAALNVKIKKLF